MDNAQRNADAFSLSRNNRYTDDGELFEKSHPNVTNHVGQSAHFCSFAPPAISLEADVLSHFQYNILDCMQFTRQSIAHQDEMYPGNDPSVIWRSQPKHLTISYIYYL